MPPAAIVAAGGRGHRAATPSQLPKQFRALAGRPVVAWSVEALASAGCAPVVVVVPPDLLEHARALLAGAGELLFAVGGATRQSSVAAGLDLVASDRVLVHDAARPLIEAHLVRELLAALGDADGAIPALPVDETPKRGSDGVVIETIERDGLWLVQTPQAFVTERLRRAHEWARRQDVVASDDAQLVERCGGRVALVRGSRTNVKITYEEDFAVADALLRRRAIRGPE